MKAMLSYFLVPLLAIALADNVAAQQNTFPQSGNVGIGTATPEDALHVVGEILSQSGSYRLRHPTTNHGWHIAGTSGGRALTVVVDPAEGGAASRMLITQDGNVGIGTTEPQARLHVGNGSITLDDERFALINMTATAPANNVRMLIDARGDGLNRGQLGTVSSHDVILITNNQIRMVIGSDGNVCIGNC